MVTARITAGCSAYSLAVAPVVLVAPQTCPSVVVVAAGHPSAVVAAAVGHPSAASRRIAVATAVVGFPTAGIIGVTAVVIDLRAGTSAHKLDWTGCSGPPGIRLAWPSGPPAEPAGPFGLADLGPAALFGLVTAETVGVPAAGRQNDPGRAAFVPLTAAIGYPAAPTDRAVAVAGWPPALAAASAVPLDLAAASAFPPSVTLAVFVDRPSAFSLGHRPLGRLY